MAKIKKRPKQLRFSNIDKLWRVHEIPKNIIVIKTHEKSIQQIVEEMMAVPMDKHMLLDIFIGYQRGDYRKLTEEQLELKRLQQLLNSEYRGERFDWLGDDGIAQMVRHSVATESWNPFLKASKNEVRYIR